MSNKKSKKPLRMRYFYVTINTKTTLEMVTFKGTMTDLFNQISMRGAAIVNSIELTEPEYRYMMEKREKFVKQNAETEKKNKEDAAKIHKEIDVKSIAKKAVENAIKIPLPIAEEIAKQAEKLNEENVPLGDPCPVCKGFGKIPTKDVDYEVCPTCKGSGKKNAETND